MPHFIYYHTMVLKRFIRCGGSAGWPCARRFCDGYNSRLAATSIALQRRIRHFDTVNFKWGINDGSDWAIINCSNSARSYSCLSHISKFGQAHIWRQAAEIERVINPFGYFPHFSNKCRKKLLRLLLLQLKLQVWGI